MACDHARLGDAHDMRVLAQSDVELKRAYRDVLRQWNPQARIAMTYRVGNHHVRPHVMRLRFLVRDERGIGHRVRKRLVQDPDFAQLGDG